MRLKNVKKIKLLGLSISECVNYDFVNAVIHIIHIINIMIKISMIK